jgi:hypothetical protein
MLLVMGVLEDDSGKRFLVLVVNHITREDLELSAEPVQLHPDLLL